MGKHNERTIKLPQRKVIENVPKEDHVALATEPQTAQAVEGDKESTNWRLRHDLLAGEVVRMEGELKFMRGVNEKLAQEAKALRKQAAEQAQVMQTQMTDINKQQQELMQEIDSLRKQLGEAKADVTVD